MSVDLCTTAERHGDAARELPAFRELSLAGIKSNVATLLSLIGREGIFATYSLHDITHAEAMLRMLDWLIPERTRIAMTPTDWLMIVLAVYLHDLGLLVTQGEFETRNDNPDYRAWFDSLPTTANGRDYVARTHRMNAEEKSRFFFQEYVRKGHAARIKEWITGRHSRTWGQQTKEIAAEIARLLASLPSRFRDYLGEVCESHHRDNLDNIEIFPLCARCGNDPREIVNVQYAAILLRTADLLHVTSDRTPSTMFQLIKLSDPKGVSEWDKQLGTFAVGPKGRYLVENDPETAVIVLHADFTEERPLFALQEYVSYGNAQIQLSKRWADRSQESLDARDYVFPWHSLIGDIRLEGVPPQPMRFDLDRGRLLDLLVGHTIYNDPTVAIRELLQNAIDAVRYQKHLESRKSPDKQTAIGSTTVKWDPSSRLLSVEDDGIGMDREIIKYHLMKVGASYYNTPQFESEHGDFTPISRFGIGILTCFMISDDVEIVTFRDSVGHRIRMTSVQADYLLRGLKPGDRELEGLEPHGTRVVLRIRDTVDFKGKSVGDIIRHWVILPECPVNYVEHGKEPEVIGFQSPAEALEYFHQQADEAKKVARTAARELITKKRKGVEIAPERPPAATYDLAFAVEQGLLPERFFAMKPADVDMPMVCIEGIRVANRLPWFEGTGRGSQLSTLLSVRGDKRFRTTVSREELEQDDDYNQIGRACTEMLFEHVEDEVGRISGSAGKPLSRASTASKWLYHDLRTRGSASRAVNVIQQLYQNLRCIVVERYVTEGGTGKSSRSMTSMVLLQEEPFFWTIESRLVDSLGTISRDLGRELSVNEFVLALAPDLEQLHYSPIVPDAQLFRESIENKHEVDVVEFSRKHQQTVLKWIVPTGGQSRRIVDLGRSTDAFIKELNRIIRDRRMSEDALDYNYESYESQIWAETRYRLVVQIGTFKGDDEKVQAVVTRAAIVLKAEGGLAEWWQRLVGQLSDVQAEAKDPELALDLMQVASVFCSSLRSVRIRPAVMREVREVQDRIQSRLSAAGKTMDFVDFLALGSSNEVFNAAAYWRDWSKASREG